VIASVARLTDEIVAAPAGAVNDEVAVSVTPAGTPAPKLNVETCANDDAKVNEPPPAGID
jgi:hypothetical protein